MNLLIELGLAVKTRRSDMGLTVSALARMSNLSRATVSSLENGSCKDLSLVRTQALLEVLGLALSMPTVHKKPSLDPLARRPALEVAAQTASVALAHYATARDLQPAFLTDMTYSLPSQFLPHLFHVLEEAPVALLARIADQLHSEKRVDRAKVWHHMRVHAQALQVKRILFAPEVTPRSGRPT